MEKSKMWYITKRLSRKLDEKNDDAIRLVEHFNERMERRHPDVDTASYAANKSFWLGYSQAMDYCQKELRRFMEDIKEEER